MKSSRLRSERVAAMRPWCQAAHGLGDGVGIGKAHPLQRAQGLGIVLDPGEHQAAEARRQRLLAGEELGVAAVDAFQGPRHRRIEAPQVRIAVEGRDAAALALVRWQAVGLLVGDHLHPVLEVAQIAVGAGQVLGGGGAHLAGLGQGGQGVEGAVGAQGRMAAAQDQLLGLDEEFDLADAAGAQLQVRARRGQALVGPQRLDLALDRMDVGNGGEVEVSPPDERLKLGQESLAAGNIAGRDPRLDRRRPLPVLADAFIVFQRLVHWHGGGGRGRIGAQAQVDAEDITLGGPVLENAGQILGEAHREGLGLDALGQG